MQKPPRNHIPKNPISKLCFLSASWPKPGDVICNTPNLKGRGIRRYKISPQSNAAGGTLLFHCISARTNTSKWVFTVEIFVASGSQSELGLRVGLWHSLGTGLSTSGIRISTRAWYRIWSQLLIHLRMGSYLHRVISLSFGRVPSGSSSLQEEEEGDRVSSRFACSDFPLPLHF